MNELAFGLHHALHVLKGLETRAGWNMAIGGAALSVEPFVSFADLLCAVLALQVAFSGGFAGGVSGSVRSRRWGACFLAFADFLTGELAERSGGPDFSWAETVVPQSTKMGIENKRAQGRESKFESRIIRSRSRFGLNFYNTPSGGRADPLPIRGTGGPLL